MSYGCAQCVAARNSTARRVTVALDAVAVKKIKVASAVTKL